MIRAKCGRSREVGSIFQFTPPRGGDGVALRFSLLNLISIHAPAWGATHRGGAGGHAPAYFNSRPRVGGDSRQLGWQSCHRSHFNSRPRVGGDPCFALYILAGLIISIHAPAWGATGPGRRLTPGKNAFQFTPPRGGRPSRF